MVEDFDIAKLFLESLGYEHAFFYEKYRTTYQIGKTHIMLDELPFGTFVEIEEAGKNPIQAVAIKMGLEWDAAIAANYHVLFERIRKKRNLKFKDLSFKNFKKLKVTAEQLSVKSADV